MMELLRPYIIVIDVLIYCFKSIRYKNTLTAKETKSEGEVMTFGFKMFQ